MTVLWAETRTGKQLMMTNSGYSSYCCGMGNLLNMTWSADNLALDFVRESDICHPDLGQILDASCPIFHSCIILCSFLGKFTWLFSGREGAQRLKENRILQWEDLQVIYKWNPTAQCSPPWNIKWCHVDQLGWVQVTIAPAENEYLIFNGEMFYVLLLGTIQSSINYAISDRSQGEEH